jgi:hypothetical protein
MKRQSYKPPYIHEHSQSRKIALPLTLAVLGASVMVMAVMLFTAEKPNTSENGSFDVENYDIVGNKPFIYSICE